jgi:hypothetical protein
MACKAQLSGRIAASPPSSSRVFAALALERALLHGPRMEVPMNKSNAPSAVVNAESPRPMSSLKVRTTIKAGLAEGCSVS